ncbi:hypothetical protein Rleg4DRAFT_5986 [Rhizobium leguminosarum bv. trifolii WSM2297]|uniref:Uncharacterized protein n=1 Tax=Rhizobium leguminosarum bv. trifolii WSM2297 TaxID=754762 RepID=J0WED2_RHILT|nr:hypothetical protein [Rhizobium leguminosarum]EJC84186.1 hypothetical protein Rleg4DRAFT_5986 [Rhizobium leguminosarum bv. trifolii WSM2297]
MAARPHPLKAVLNFARKRDMLSTATPGPVDDVMAGGVEGKNIIVRNGHMDAGLPLKCS